MSKEVVRYQFEDGSTADVPLDQVLDALQEQLHNLARATGNTAPRKRLAALITAKVRDGERVAGGRKKGSATMKARATERDPVPAWMADAFRIAYDALAYQDRKRIGRSMLATVARRLYPIGDSRRAEISHHLARVWLAKRGAQ